MYILKDENSLGEKFDFPHTPGWEHSILGPDAPENSADVIKHLSRMKPDFTPRMPHFMPDFFVRCDKDSVLGRWRKDQKIRIK